VDAVEVLRDRLARDGQIEVIVDNELFGGTDPAPRVQKTRWIELRQVDRLRAIKILGGDALVLLVPIATTPPEPI